MIEDTRNTGLQHPDSVETEPRDAAVTEADGQKPVAENAAVPNPAAPETAAEPAAEKSAAPETVAESAPEKPVSRKSDTEKTPAKNPVKVNSGTGGFGEGTDTRFRSKRRRPKRNVFLRAMLVYVSAALLIIGALVCIGWRYISLRDAALPDSYVSGLSVNTDTEGWRQLLRRYLPEAFPEYENATLLAYDILSPALDVGNVTYIRYAGRSGAPVYELFSDGRAFATLTLSDASKGLLGLGLWEIGSIDFHLSFFDKVSFPVTEITVPQGAVLTVNGIAGVTGNTVTDNVPYPALTPAEEGAAVAPCTRHTFRDIYYPPELSAVLDDVTLELLRTGDGGYYFAYPASARHTVTVTVPEGVTAMLGSAVISDAWATRVKIEGELGELDDGGSGTLPMLDVWTIDGVFGNPAVSAEVYGNAVKLLSSENNNYVFETPAECKYNITVIVPAGSTVTVNGRPLDAATKVAGGATMEDMDSGSTALGNYSVAELAAVPEVLPAFDKYIVSGYLAMPNIEAKLGDTELVTAGVTTSVYNVLWEFDYTSSGTFDEARSADAKKFTESYIKYLCDGGAWQNSANAALLDANYEALKSQLVPGTSAYVSMMESYRTVFKLPHYDSYSVDLLTTDGYVVYSDGCVSCRVGFSVTRTLGTGDGAVTDVMAGSMMVLQVRYLGEWQIWGFIYSDTPPAANP